MSLSLVYSRAQLGIDAPLVRVETHLSFGLPKFSIVGLPEAEVKESKDRVRSALITSHFEFPLDRITVNLSPADLPKEGGRFDLPIALGVLAASGQIPLDHLEEFEFAGELSLAGDLRFIRGILPLALAARKAKKHLFVPEINADEAALVSSLNVFPARHLLDVCAHLSGNQKLIPHVFSGKKLSNKYSMDLSEVRGQPYARRSLEIAAAGGHSILFIGPPGTGKTMLASRLPTIMPDISDEESLEVASISSISSKGFNFFELGKRPFRSPHHSASAVALVGGGNPPKPGEISLAHKGILFLDELPEFNRRVLEALREPLESGVITISRAARQNEFPAEFQLVVAMNPCQCGYLGDPEEKCRCSEKQIQKYRASVSGPIFDRIDMHVEVPRLPPSALSLYQPIQEETSAVVKERVKLAVERQLNRSGKLNAKLTVKDLEKYCVLDKSAQSLIDDAMKRLKFSARGYHRIIKVALTIADLNCKNSIEINHLAEALSFRKLSR